MEYEAINHQLMDENPINKRRLIEEDVYDELPSTDTISGVICNENESTDFPLNDSHKKRKSRDSIFICINCFIPALYILTISLK
jgi:hypothetical protein